MHQGKHFNVIKKLSNKGFQGYPVATVAFYGPDNTKATKVVCAIVENEQAEPDPIYKWFSSYDARQSDALLSEVIEFIVEHKVRSIAMAESIIGCPHEEGIDYPQGANCPVCLYWRHRNRFTHDLIH